MRVVQFFLGLPLGTFVAFWKEPPNHAPTLLSNIRWTVGKDRTIVVLNDAWLGENSIACWPTMANWDALKN